ncbi:MAG TPA: hypothetical protein VLA81_10240 [Burkholderiales bacterium]|nr:hypothetical protein [Burkholderiales bacterium]
MAHDLDSVRAALVKSRSRLLPQTNVVATGVGYKVTKGRKTDALSIVCSVRRKVALSQLAARDQVPATIDGIPTDVVATGVIRAFQERTARHRPAPGGVSIGHRDITAGTLGCLVRRGGQVFILSNNHVLANSNGAVRGDAILQPGPVDGGRFPDDHIAALEDFVPITFLEPPSECQFARGVIAVLNAGCQLIDSKTRYRTISIQATENRVDAAIARPLDPTLVKKEILEIGAISGLGTGSLGAAIKKSGRTTGLTAGEVMQVDVTVNVQYGPGQTAQFSDQLLAGPMSQGGDSGSAVLDNNNRLIGLLFAGSDNSTIINRIEHVFSELGLTL